jgi:hypothetical protein
MDHLGAQWGTEQLQEEEGWSVVGLCLRLGICGGRVSPGRGGCTLPLDWKEQSSMLNVVRLANHPFSWEDIRARNQSSDLSSFQRLHQSHHQNNQRQIWAITVAALSGLLFTYSSL